MNFKTDITIITQLLACLFSVGCSAKSIIAERSLNTASFKPTQIYTFESDGSGFNTKTFFYDNGEEVVVFDSQFTPEIARKALSFLRSKTQNPIRYVVITHPNPDKFNGMSVFQEQGAKVIASRATVQSMQPVHDYKKYFFVNIAKMFTEETYPKLAQVDIAFDQAYEIRLQNGDSVQLSELAKPGVSSNQTIAWIPTQNSLFVGDLVHHQAHAWLEGGIVKGQATPSLNGWIADLKELSQRFGTQNPLVYGGRGQTVQLDLAVATQIDYLQKADVLVAKYIASLGLRKVELSDAQKAGAHYAALQALFEKTFAKYSLGYMIQYGIYGLVNQKL